MRDRRWRRSLLAAAGMAVVTLVSSRARASDRVAVLRFTASGGGTTSMQLDSARASTRDAVGLAHDTLPTPAEMAAAEAAVKDGVPDTSDEYRQAGRAATVTWTLAGHVDAHGVTYRLELDACQVATGRVESLAREVDAREAAPQIAEMLALLLRPQGVGDAIPPWDQPPSSAPAPKPVAPSPVAEPAPLPTLPPVALPPEPPSPAVPYAADHPLGVGLGGEGLDAFARAHGARGSAAAVIFTGTFVYALSGVPGLELLVDAGVGSVGPTSLRVDAGARYLLPLARSARLYVGPEAALGAFFPLGGDKDARFLVRGALPLIWGAASGVQIELYPELAYAAGGTVSLGFVGGGGRVVLRF